MAIKRKTHAIYSKINSILLFKKVFLNKIPEIPVTSTIRNIENILKISIQMFNLLSLISLFFINFNLFIFHISLPDCKVINVLIKKQTFS